MTFRDRLTKIALTFSVLLIYLVGYFLVNELTSRRAGVYHLDLPFEKNIPLFPAFIFAYLLEFAFFALAYLMINDLAFFKKVAIAVSLSLLIHLVIFLVFPVEYRLQYNRFPSLHVSNVVLISCILEKYRKGMGWILSPLAVVLAVSAVFLKQHSLADILAGFFMGWFVYRQVFGDVPRQSSVPRK